MELHTALRLNLDPARPDVVSVVGGGGKSSAVFRIALDLAKLGQRAVITHTARIAAFQTAWSPATVQVLDDVLPWAEIAGALDRHNVCLLTGPVVADRRAGLPPPMVDELALAGTNLGIAAITVEADGSKMRPAKAPAEHEPVLPAATTLLAPVLGLDAVGAAVNSRLFHRDELVRGVLGLPENGEMCFTPRHAAELLVHPAGGAKARTAGARLLPIFNKADTPLRLLYGRLAANHLATRGQASLLTAVGAAADDPVIERWGTVAVVILAAGASTRFGAPKQLAAVHGRPMLVTALATAATMPGPIFVVTGAYAADVEALLDSLPASLRHQLGNRLHVLHNPNWASGQASSLHVSVRGLPDHVQAGIWMPVDQPYLDPALLTQLAAAWRQGADLAAPAVSGDLRGAPALFDRLYWPDLLLVEGDAGGRSILRRHAARVRSIHTPEAALRDVDSPQDLT
ncbi:MAG: selenium cofactor biosynthesis protein YqeC [Caldilineaceae bacterium]